MRASHSSHSRESNIEPSIITSELLSRGLSTPEVPSLPYHAGCALHPDIASSHVWTRTACILRGFDSMGNRTAPDIAAWAQVEPKRRIVSSRDKDKGGSASNAISDDVMLLTTCNGGVVVVMEFEWSIVMVIVPCFMAPVQQLPRTS